MSPGPSVPRLAQRTSRVVRAVLMASLVLAISACDQKRGTPAWDHTDPLDPAAGTSAKTPAKPSRSRAKPPAAAPLPAAAAPSTEGLRFIAYNVENWLTMEREDKAKHLQSLPKPAAEKQAVLRLLLQNAPDVIGLCEIGEASDLAEIQQSLKAAGLDLAYSLYTGGSDPIRHLGLLSRFPIRSPPQPAALDYRMRGHTYAINRGILDASLDAHGKTYRFLGAHLKSKREIQNLDQEEMRIHEARLLRRQADAILLENPQTRLVVYGDFNDSPMSKAVKTVTGNHNDAGYLTIIQLKDSRGDAWTHYWGLHDLYSRLDYVTVNQALKSGVDFRASRIIDDPTWAQASDHRPLLVVFK